MYTLSPPANHGLQLVAEQHGPVLPGRLHNIPIALEPVRVQPPNEFLLVNLPITILVQRIEEVQDLTNSQIDVEGRDTEPEMLFPDEPLMQDVEKPENFLWRLECKAKLSCNLVS